MPPPPEHGARPRRTLGRLTDPRDDLLWCTLGAAPAGAFLALVGHAICTTSPTAGQLIDGTERDVRCGAVVGPSRAVLCGLLVLLPPVITSAVGLTSRRRVVPVLACVLSVAALIARLGYLSAAPDFSLAP